jgi:hypothetical protein
VNIFQQEDVIKGMPDQALMKEAQAPTGRIPQYLVVSEIQRRADMRKRFAGEQQSMPQSTVKDQIVSGGIVGVGQQRQAPQGRMMPQMPAAQPMPPQQPMPVPPQPMPQQMPQQAMSNGGVVRMFDGRGTPFTPQGSTLEELAESIYDYQRPKRKGNPFQYVEGTLSREDLMRSILGQDAYVPSFKESDKVARPKFVESAVESGMLEQYLPREEDQFLETKVEIPKAMEGYETNEGMFAPIGGTLADIKKIDLPFATTIDKELFEAGSSDKSTEDKVNQDINKGSVFERGAEILMPDGGDYSALIENVEVDTSPIEAVSDKFNPLLEELKNRPKADYRSLIQERTQDFMQFAPDYEGLITDQELKAKKIREDARKDAGAQALIQLGAGILEGNVGEGLRGAGKASSEIMAQARAEASAEEKLANTMKLSEKEAQMNLGIMGEEAAQRQYDRNTDLIIKEYADDRAAQLSAMNIRSDIIKAEVEAETSVAQLIYNAQSDKRQFHLDKIVKAAAIQRYEDLRKEENQATLRAIMQQIQDPLEEWLLDYRRSIKGKDVSMDQMQKDINKIINTFLTAYGQKPVPVGGKEEDSLSVSKETSSPNATSTNKIIDFSELN